MMFINPGNTMYLIILFICIAEASAMACVKNYHDGNGLIYFMAAVALYAIVCYLLHCSYYYKNSMGLTNIIWSGLSVLMVALFGILIFHEKLHFHDIIAGLFITTGLLIIKYTD